MLARLPELSNNLFFSWHRPTRALFEDLDAELWKQAGGNPRLILRCINQENLDRAAADADYRERYRQVLATFDAYLAAPPPRVDEPLIAYFCAEYGFHESFPIYSGGLGILAGDHCKAASDERLNFIAVGLLYTEGYFIQSVDADGVQHANYSDTDPRDLPVEAVRDQSGQWLRVRVPIAGRSVCARIWKAHVGRVTVYLLDTNCPENSGEDREITHRLYGGDASVRIRQEMILGLGGVRALRALGLAPATWHMNEGHAAFLILELAREGLARGLDFSAALELAAAQCVFTTHTPVAAGHDAFDTGLFSHCFQEVVAELGVPMERVLALGRAAHSPQAFNMTHLALNGARRMNGVSRIHGVVSARLCADHWPQVPAEENPVGYVTNGVHVPTFLAQTWSRFFDDRLGVQWRERLSDVSFWRALEKIPDEEYWQTAQRVKSRMLAGVRERLQREYAAKGLSPAQLRHITRLLDPDRPNTLTLGFRAPLCHLQARLTDDARSRSHRPAAQRSGAPGTDTVCRQSSPGRSSWPAGAARDQAIDADPGICRPRRFSRGLRPAAGALAGDRRRRMAQQPGGAARGQRHLGNQGCDQRPAQSEHSRWLVGGGLRSGQRLGHPRSQRAGSQPAR